MSKLRTVDAKKYFGVDFPSIEDVVIGRSSSSKSIVITSDLHVGHFYALGSPLKKLQSINEFWASAPDKLRNGRSNVFVVNGEPVDGDNPRGLAGEQWTSDEGEQMELAADLIDCFKTDSIGLTRGSDYHSSRGNTNKESILTKYLKSPVLDYSPYGKHFKEKHIVTSSIERNPVSHRQYTRIEDILQLRLHDCVFNFIHHTGVPGSFHTAPASIATQILKNLIATDKLWTKKYAPTFTIRGHTHQFVWVEYGNSAGGVTPAWQIFSKYTLQKSMTAASIGLIEIVVESNNTYTLNKIILPDKDYPKINVIDIK